MNPKHILLYSSISSIIGLAFALSFIPGLPKAFATTTVTITGWNVPSATTFNNGIVAFILPLATMAVFAAFPMILDQKGDFVVTMALIGLLIGSAASMLQFGTTAANPLSIEFAFVVISGIFLGFWLWRSGG